MFTVNTPLRICRRLSNFYFYQKEENKKPYRTNIQHIRTSRHSYTTWNRTEKKYLFTFAFFYSKFLIKLMMLCSRFCVFLCLVSFYLFVFIFIYFLLKYVKTSFGDRINKKCFSVWIIDVHETKSMRPLWLHFRRYTIYLIKHTNEIFQYFLY